MVFDKRTLAKRTRAASAQLSVREGEFPFEALLEITQATSLRKAVASRKRTVAKRRRRKRIERDKEVVETVRLLKEKRRQVFAERFPDTAGGYDPVVRRPTQNWVPGQRHRDRVLIAMEPGVWMTRAEIAEAMPLPQAGRHAQIVSNRETLGAHLYTWLKQDKLVEKTIIPEMVGASAFQKRIKPSVLFRLTQKGEDRRQELVDLVEMGALTFHFEK
jgi:hypothetical protein